MSDLTKEQIERYIRQIILPDFGERGQKKLQDGRVLVAGTGGLGSPAAFYLAAAGIGTLGIVDDDMVELSNLQRQILHSTPDIGSRKTASAAEKLSALNPDVTVVQHKLRVNSVNIRGLIRDYHIVLDCTDNFPARFLFNDACVMEKKPLVHAGVFQFEGQAMTVVPGAGPCYRCIFPEPPPPGLIPTGRRAGILGCVAGVLGTIQATEAIKILLGIGEPLVGTLLIYSAREMNFRRVAIPRDKNCAVCGDRPTITELIDYERS